MIEGNDANGSGESSGRSRRRSGGSTAVTRRDVLKSTAGAGALAIGVGAGFSGRVTAGIEAFQDLGVDADNRIVNESDEPFVMRGLNVPDPKLVAVTEQIRGKTATQIVDLITSTEEGWYPRVVRVPATPVDIGEHPMGHTGGEYEEGELTNPDPVRDDRRKMLPPQPPAFTESQLVDYLNTYYDPIVQRCKEQGVYCIVDYHRHWHEQPPGEEMPSAAENHLDYDSEYTNYWAYNTHDEFGTDAPASWGYVDQVTINELTPDYDGWAGIESEDDVPGTPYAEDMWQVNEALLDEVTTFWKVVADRYADESHVIFEPYNEPTEPGIWGPVEGCGAVKQHGLWNVFLDDFAAPILNEIRAHAPEKLVLMSVPGWCQSVQGLHWRDFDDLGFENLAVTWHNYGRHDVSQVHNWLNDTDYESLEVVEEMRGETLEDPFIPPIVGDNEPDECWGWESFQASGLQNAMDHHPVAVTEFGWRPRTDSTHWIRGAVSPDPTTASYGEPFLDAMESDDRISWVAWCADVRWLPKLFDVTWNVDEGELDLTNGNWYETPESELPVGCEDLPCEWELRDDPDMGAFVKQRLADNRRDRVPFETIDANPPPQPTSPADQWVNEATETTIDVGWAAVDAAVHYTVYLDDEVVARPESTSTELTGLDPGTSYELGLSAVNAVDEESGVATTTVGTAESAGPPAVGENDAAPLDPDGDGLYEDVNGNGQREMADVVDFFQHRESDAVQDHVDAFDFSENGEIDVADAVELFQENA